MNVPFWTSQSLGRLSMLLFLGAVVWLGICWFLFEQVQVNWSTETAGAVLAVGLPGVMTCSGMVLGAFGLLPGNRDRLWAALGAVLNGVGLVLIAPLGLAGL